MTYSGRLRYQVEIQAQLVEQDSYGQRVSAWNTVLTVFADVQVVNGAEVRQGETIHGTVSYLVTMRWRPDFSLTTQHRLRWRGMILDITGVAEDLEWVKATAQRRE